MKTLKTLILLTLSLAFHVFGQTSEVVVTGTSPYMFVTAQAGGALCTFDSLHDSTVTTIICSYNGVVTRLPKRPFNSTALDSGEFHTTLDNNVGASFYWNFTPPKFSLPYPNNQPTLHVFVYYNGQFVGTSGEVVL